MSSDKRNSPFIKLTIVPLIIINILACIFSITSMFIITDYVTIIDEIIGSITSINLCAVIIIIFDIINGEKPDGNRISYNSFNYYFSYHVVSQLICMMFWTAVCSDIIHLLFSTIFITIQLINYYSLERKNHHVQKSNK